MMKSALLAAVALGCGGRVGVDVDDAGDAAATFDSNVPTCTKPPWIVFDYMDGVATDYRIHAMHPDGSAFHALDLDGKRATLPSASRDGTKLGYVQYDDSGPAETETLMLRDLTTKTSTALGWPGTVILYWSTISPDDHLVVYSSAYLNMYVISADGSGLRQLIQPNGGWGSFPVFSNDSSTVYFVAGGGVLTSVGADGSDMKALTSNTSSKGEVGAGLALSPDGTRVVVPVLCNSSWQLRIFTLADLPGDSCTAGVMLMPFDFQNTGSNVVHPSWSDSDVIMYSDSRDLHVVPAAGGASTNITSQLTGSSGWANDAVWVSGCSDL